MDMRNGPSGHLSHTGEAHFSDKDRRRRRLRSLLVPDPTALKRRAATIAAFVVGDVLSAVLEPEFEALGSLIRSLLGLG